MKFFNRITITAALLTAMTYIPASAKNVMVPKAYMFGFVASFNDSIVFLTDIQEVDSVWIQEKKKLLAGRSNYSHQLREFFTNSFGMSHRTCVVISDIKRKNVEKKYAKMKKQYAVKGSKKYDVHYTDASEFRFKPVNMDDSSVQLQQAHKKKDKKKDKKKEPNERPPMPPRK